MSDVPRSLDPDPFKFLSMITVPFVLVSSVHASTSSVLNAGCGSGSLMNYLEQVVASTIDSLSDLFNSILGFTSINIYNELLV